MNEPNLIREFNRHGPNVNCCDFRSKGWIFFTIFNKIFFELVTLKQSTTAINSKNISDVFKRKHDFNVDTASNHLKCRHPDNRLIALKVSLN